jgi:hypothetical protein
MELVMNAEDSGDRTSLTLPAFGWAPPSPLQGEGK